MYIMWITYAQLLVWCAPCG